MKNSKINPEDLLKDTDKILDLLDKIENTNIEKINLEDLEKEIESVGVKIKNKYKKYLNKEDINNLDTKE